MLQITILKGPPNIIEGISSKTGKPYRMVQQAAFLTHPDGRVEAFTSQGKRNGQTTVPYEPGTYTLAPESFYVRNGDLSFAPRLIPVAAGGGGTKP